MNQEGERSIELIGIFLCFSFNRYGIHLKSAKKSGIRKGAVNGILMGTIFCLLFSTYALV
jgi:hypothetical protein